jgi:hypothetical protein
MKIISGGQTGADQAALEAAKNMGFETGGYAPKGYLTEKGNDLSLKEFGLVDSGLNYTGRTELNVINSDLTLWFGIGDTAGYLATKKYCNKHSKPFIDCNSHTAFYIRSLISSASVINVAGNRESVAIGTHDRVYRQMTELLWSLKPTTQTELKF